MAQLPTRMAVKVAVGVDGWAHPRHSPRISTPKGRGRSIDHESRSATAVTMMAEAKKTRRCRQRRETTIATIAGHPISGISQWRPIRCTWRKNDVNPSVRLSSKGRMRSRSSSVNQVRGPSNPMAANQTTDAAPSVINQ